MVFNDQTAYTFGKRPVISIHCPPFHYQRTGMGIDLTNQRSTGQHTKAALLLGEGYDTFSPLTPPLTFSS